MDTYEELLPDDVAQAAVVEAIFVYNTAMRDEMLPRKPLPVLMINLIAKPSSPAPFPDAIPPMR
jgi:carboxypeptidase Q